MRRLLLDINTGQQLSLAVSPPAIASVARPVPVAPTSELNGSGVQGDFCEQRELLYPPTKWFASKHAVVLHDSVQVLHSRARQLKPFVPNELCRGQNSAAILLKRGVKLRDSPEVAITEVALKWVLRVQVASVHESMSVIRIHTEEATSIDQLSSERDCDQNKKTWEVVVPVDDISCKCPVG